MKNVILIVSLFVSSLGLSLFGQNISLTFAGDNNGQSVVLDSVLVTNTNQGGEVMLYPPDLSLTLIITRNKELIAEANTAFELNQNYPNPFISNTSVKIHVPGTSLVKMVISNLLGQNLLSTSKALDAGAHTFSFSPGNESCYFLTTCCEGHSQTIKMLCKPDGDNKSIRFRHSETINFDPILKSLQMLGELPFELGDKLMIVAYSEMGESGMLSSPDGSQEYVLQFATNIACPGAETVNWGGQTYNTIQVFGQCWFKENLNIGLKINSSVSQSNNSIIEKYCFNDDEYNCSLVGGLYSWSEMMQYYSQTGGQGICPDGWHIPDDMEWQILEGAADSIINIGDPVWGTTGWRGFDAGGNLKQTGTTYWQAPNSGATNAFGFEVLPAGYCVQNSFWGASYKAYFWSSKYPQKYYRNMDWDQVKIQRSPGDNQVAFSVRCIKD